MQAIIMLDQ
jgi:hypothetical protein